MTVTAVEQTMPEQTENSAPGQEPAPATAVAVPESTVGSLTIDPKQAKLRPEQKAALKGIGITDEFEIAQIRVFIHFCQVRRLDPWAKEAYLIKRKDKYSIQTSIDTYRRKAFETGRYRRRVGVYWTGRSNDAQWWIVDPQTRIRHRVWTDVWLDKEPPAAARCLIEYYDERGDVVTTEAVVNWEMFAGTTWKNGEKVPNEMWTKGGPHMLAKCAEALALRSAFPTALSGFFIQEEMNHLDEMDTSERVDRFRERRAAARAEAEAAEQTPAPPVQPAEPTPVVPQQRPSGEPVTLEGDVVDNPAPAAAPEEDATGAEQEFLLDELTEQARIMGTSPAKLAVRLIAAHRANLENLPVAALRTLVVSLRSGVATLMEGRDAKAAADTYRDLPEQGDARFRDLLPWVRAETAESDR